MIERKALAAQARTARERDRLLASVCRDLSAQNRWLKARLAELHVRVKALDGITPDPPPQWPAIAVPPELRDLLTEE